MADEHKMTGYRDYYKNVLETIRYGFTELLITNLLWVVFTLLIITAPAAFAGMYYATHTLAKEKSASWRTFFVGFKDFFWVGWRWR